MKPKLSQKKNCFIEIYGEIVHISLQTAAKSCMNLTADQELTLVFLVYI